MTSYNTTAYLINNNNFTEATILFVATAVGCLGNIGVMTMILIVKKFRKSSSAFICHQCLLDGIKSLYCFLYGYNLLCKTKVPVCHIVGASYVFFVTVSAYNLLAIVVNEEYELQTPPTKKDKNHFCIIFGISIIWFMCLLMNMGVAFLPKEPEFIPETGNCIFAYGSPSNFVLHMLWMVLVSMAIFMALAHFVSMYCHIKYRSSSSKWSFIHRSLLREMDSADNVEMSTDPNSCRQNYLYTYLYLRRIAILLSMVLSFVICWYPLFTLTLVDYRFQQPKLVYKLLTILTWCHPATTPVFSILILHDSSKKDGIMRRIYSNIYPMMQFYQNPTSHPMLKKHNDSDDTEVKNTQLSQENIANTEHEALVNQIQDNLLQESVDQTSVSELNIQQWDCSPTGPGRTCH